MTAPFFPRYIFLNEGRVFSHGPPVLRNIRAYSACTGKTTQPVFQDGGIKRRSKRGLREVRSMHAYPTGRTRPGIKTASYGLWHSRTHACMYVLIDPLAKHVLLVYAGIPGCWIMRVSLGLIMQPVLDQSSHGDYRSIWWTATAHARLTSRC
jgi:hypothetical protein